MQFAKVVVAVFLSSSSTACTLLDAPGAPDMSMTGQPSPPREAGSATPDVDASAVVAMIAGGAYLTSGLFSEVTRSPYASAAAAGKNVREWVSANAAAEYSKVSPTVLDAGANMPVGATIVRAVLDDAGVTAELTVMCKGPPGYNPDLGDWWFGVLDPTGVPLTTDAGTMMGQLTGCYSCHSPRTDDDFLFGVPLDDRK